MPRHADRVARLEALLPQPAADELVELVKFMSFGELCAGQRAMLAYDCDVHAGLVAGDPTLVALYAAARARAAGITIPELFAMVEGHDAASSALAPPPLP
jgi:hypothetical protein